MSAVTDWNTQAVDRLLDRALCPVCASARLVLGRCPACAADLSGPSGVELWDASQQAAAALRAREAIRQRVPRVAMTVPVASHAPVASPPATAPGVTAPPPSGSEKPAAGAARSATLQSVLAAAGASLFAIAAIIFTFLNPDLADRAVRGWIVAAVTTLFLAAAWLLARRGLRFSAEAVGALGLIFVVLDVHAVAATAPTSEGALLLAAPVTAIAAGMVLAAALRTVIRVWLWASVVALVATPAMLGAAGGTALPAALGQLAAAALAVLLVAGLPRLAARAGVDSPALGAEAVTLTVAQFLLTVTATATIVLRAEPLPVALVLALAAGQALFAARGALPVLWSALAGLFAGAAAIALMVGVLPGIRIPDDAWMVVLVVAASLPLLATAAVPLSRGVSRPALCAGAGAVLAAVLMPAVATALLMGGRTALLFVETILRENQSVLGSEPVADGYLVGVVASVAIGAAAVAAFGLMAARRRAGAAARTALRGVAISLAALAVCATAALPGLTPGAGVTIALLAAVAGILCARATAGVLRGLLLAGGLVAAVLGVMLTWITPQSVPFAGPATVVALALYAAWGPRIARPVFVGAAYAYALIVLAGTLGLIGVTGVAQLCLTASVGLLGAIVATFLPWTGARTWQAVLLVASVPFGIAVAQVMVLRSGWTAVSTAVMFALALTLTLTRRPGLTVLVRTGAAALLVPTAAVVIVCLGAELLEQSGSPIVLPVIAVVVAVVLPSTAVVEAVLQRRGRGRRAALAARIAVETSTLLTAAITVLLSFAREAAGLGTACLVLLILGVGAALTGAVARRRYGWWMAGAAFTAALWTAWALAGVTLPEAYLLPPSLGAAALAALLTLRGVAATGLFSAGLGGALVPLVVLSAVASPTGGAPSPRIIALFAASVALLLAATMMHGSKLRVAGRLRPLGLPLTVASGVAASAATVQAVRWGVGVDVVGGWSAASVFLAALVAGASAMVVIALAARMIRRQSEGMPALRDSRWLGVPAVLALLAAVWPAIERDWFVIWAMWSLMLVVLAGMVIAARRAVRGAVAPPVWVLFALAFITAVVAWSPRDLRVEWFSLPLGAALLLAGAHALGLGDAGSRRGRWDAWPARHTGSWALLAPGLTVMVSASVVATFTDPLTWRAILVMVIALAAILWGASSRLAAPFLIGLIVLPIENVFVFAVQLGRGIEAMPWWITLAVVGAVLLIIAVTSERRAGEGRGVVARVRDLR
ncbi:SCO7613 C-terminal domain-containing membrane protein [Microbacterium istanbulense]|uniref:DUF2157 domain-containing protein n=1 Tax=Microbacterium istanbulense TaxID=3122049 RepID=A0ABU8LGN1_9MICO